MGRQHDQTRFATPTQPPRSASPPPAYDSLPRPTPQSSSSTTTTAQPSTSTKKSTLPLHLPTKKYPLSSGFPYHPALFSLHIPPTTWTSFSDSIVAATRLSLTQQSLAWTSGLSVGLVSVAAVPPFGAAAGVFAGKAVYDKNVLSNVRQGLEDGKLGEVLERWNREVWRGKGMSVRLVVRGGEKGEEEAKGEAKGKKGKEKEKKRRDVGRFALLLEALPTISSPIPIIEPQVIMAVEEPHTNTNTFSLENTATATTPPASQPPTSTLALTTNSTSTNNPHPTTFANEKAAVAAERLSWASSTHPSERSASPSPPVSASASPVSPCVSPISPCIDPASLLPSASYSTPSSPPSNPSNCREPEEPPYTSNTAAPSLPTKSPQRLPLSTKTQITTNTEDKEETSIQRLSDEITRDFSESSLTSHSSKSTDPAERTERSYEIGQTAMTPAPLFARARSF